MPVAELCTSTRSHSMSTPVAVLCLSVTVLRSNSYHNQNTAINNIKTIGAKIMHFKTQGKTTLHVDQPDLATDGSLAGYKISSQFRTPFVNPVYRPGLHLTRDTILS